MSPVVQQFGAFDSLVSNSLATANSLSNAALSGANALATGTNALNAALVGANALVASAAAVVTVVALN